MNAARELAREILTHPSRYEWTVQGLGMLRTYLDGERFRLHIWNSSLRVENVTMLHDHPWDFDSEVIVGAVTNTRFVKSQYGAMPVMEQAIICGMGGGVARAPIPVKLDALPSEKLLEGDRYTQLAHEIHKSEPLEGTVTLIDRTFHVNTEVAHVYYDREWVSAEPRPAAPEEVAEIVAHSLERWF